MRVQNLTMKSISKPSFRPLLLFVLMTITCVSFAQSNGFDVKKKNGVVGPAPTPTKVLGGDADFNSRTNLVRHPDLGAISVKMLRDDETGLPLYVNSFPTPINTDIKSPAGRAEAALVFLESIASFDKMLGANYSYEIVEDKMGKNGNYHLRVAWKYNDIEIYGGDMTIHLNDENLSCNTRLFHVPQLEGQLEVVGEQLAILKCKNDLIVRGGFVEFGEKENEYYPQGQFQSELVWYKHPEENRVALVYHIDSRPNFVKHRAYFVDALSGEIIFTYDHICNIGPATANATDLNGVSRTINTFEGDSQYYLYDASREMYEETGNAIPEEGDGVIVTLDMNNSGMSSPSYGEITSSNNTWNQAVAVSAHFNAGESYEYWRQTHGRNSINGQGGDIVSFINVAEDDGSSLENAFWNGQYMFYGNGGQAFEPLAGALDVAGHEMSHGVVQNTANLEYYSESGAINESMADIFGAMIDRDDWQMGEDITNPSFFPTGALRDLSNPHNGGSSLSDVGSGYQPQTVSEMYTGSEDNAGVHINSGIPNYAFYLIASDIGKEKAEKIYYEALSQYLTKSSRFVDLRAAVEMATVDLNFDSDLATVQNAFAAVGIGGGGSAGGTVYQEDLSENEGDEFVIVHGLVQGSDAELELINLQESSVQPLSTTDVLRRPSITDDGRWLYFLGTDKQLRRIDMSTQTEELIFPEFVFDNVAVSKDGTKLAAISTQAEPAIYFHIIGSADDAWVRADLYNPTYSDGITTGGVQYADALEWDLAGENLLYDAFNSVTNTSGEDRSYWDVGIINVWDNATSDWTEGKIEKVFSNLPEGISIGNASYSKNSPYIIVFDYLDSLAEDLFGQIFTQHLVVGSNLENGNANQIYENNTLGFPNYSVDDSQLLFTTDNDSNRSVGIIGIASDKISPEGNATVFLESAEWPLWYANGERDLEVGIGDAPPLLNLSLGVYPIPFTESINIHLASEEDASYNYKIFDFNGRSLASGEIYSDLNVYTKDWSVGFYTLMIYNSKGVLSHKLLKTE